MELLTLDEHRANAGGMVQTTRSAGVRLWRYAGLRGCIPIWSRRAQIVEMGEKVAGMGAHITTARGGVQIAL